MFPIADAKLLALKSNFCSTEELFGCGVEVRGLSGQIFQVYRLLKTRVSDASPQMAQFSSG